MDKKVNYKLHKVKKQWVTIAVASAALAGVVGGATATSSSVSADEATKAKVTGASDVDVEVTLETPASTDAQVTASSSSDTTASTEATVEATADVASEVTKTDSQEASQVTTTADASVAQISVTAQEPSEEPSTKVVESSSEDVKAATTEASKTVVAATTSTDNLSDAEVSAALSLDNIKNVDGKYYYVNEDGSYKENFAITVNGQLIYFGKDGALTSTSTYSFSEGVTTVADLFSKNNRSYDSTQASFELIDGFLTADSWYRPAAVLENGETWKTTTTSDFRPLLMAWWPDVDTQVNYLNYFSNLFNLDTTYSVEQNQSLLNEAAKHIQVRIEQEIAAKASTKWLRDAMAAFVKEQAQWNQSTENYSKGGGDDHLQGGALLYVNDPALTPWADSRYRLLNRTPTNQTGTINKDILDKTSDANNIGGFDFLLANDVDNSNPVVQAEQLNQIHYLMNWGEIVMGDKDANFDGIRVDAVDNVNADLLQIYTNYFRAAYGVDKSEANALAHISVLEAWNYNDNHYNRETNGAALAMENKQRLALLYSLAKPIAERTPAVSPLYNNTFNTTQKTDSTEWINDDGTVRRNADGTPMMSDIGKVNDKYGDADASYVFIRAHDNQVQDIIAEIIKKEINPSSDGFTITDDEMKQAFKIYYEDMNKGEKKYTLSNIPAAYAMMFQTMEVVTRVYYGDLYTDDGNYMETKTPYFDAITTLMKNRMKYVSGGQAIRSYWLATDGSMDNSDVELYRKNEVVASVRYGKDIMTADQTEGSEYSRTSGQVTIVANNPKLSLHESARMDVNMGKIHADQEYRPLIIGTADGIKTFASDQEAIAAGYLKKTDSNGVLTFGANDIKGYSTVDMSGFVAVWVPVGASDDQDIRVAASTAAYKEGDQTFQATEALDSQLIYEGFSNFQTIPDGSDPSLYTNRKIAENAELFKSWGITSFEMAPQYVSADDGTFLDSVIQNGYAFSDRYDLAMSKNNKYGSKEDLRDALKALHAVGIQAIADWVPDQIYQLPGKEVVTATRTDNYGRKVSDAVIDNSLYVANTKSSGTDYQAKYGGEFLEELKAKYPELFTAKMISTGVPIDDSVKLKQWSAKYMNGTNILGRGAKYVLSDEATGKYFTVDKDGTFLPLQMSGKTVTTGFFYDGKGMTYYGTSGLQAKGSFVTFNGNTYYFNPAGYMVQGTELYIKDSLYRFLPNGIMLSNAMYEDTNGNTFVYNAKGQMYRDGYFQFTKTDTKEDGSTTNTTLFRYFNKKGVMAKGITIVDGNIQYFDENGYQVKNKLESYEGNYYFLEAHSGNAVTSSWRNLDGNWYYFDENGVAATGAREINGQKLLFNEDGTQVKGQVVKNDDGTLSKYNPSTGELVVNEFFTTGDNIWYYAGEDGKTVTGYQFVNNQHLYFNGDGTQVKGGIVENPDGTRSTFDVASGDLITNRFFTNGQNVWYYAGADGKSVTGPQTIDGQDLYFRQDGSQVKGETVLVGPNQVSYFDAETGEKIKNRTVRFQNGVELYFDAQGIAQIGN